MICDLTGKKVLFGNSISNSNIHTKRKFNINIVNKTFVLNGKNNSRIKFKLNLSTNGLKTIIKHQGIYNSLTNLQWYNKTKINKILQRYKSIS